MDYLGSFGDILISKLQQPKTISLSEWIINRAKKRGYKTKPISTCKDCKVELILSGGAIVCNNCGLSSDYAMVDAYCRTVTPYKRLTHFKDWLLKSQAKHSVIFKDNLIENIHKKCLHPTYFSIRNYLKKHGLFKHYEDIALILFILTGNLHFKLTSKEEELLCNYFNQITKVYNQFKLKKRKSIISYSFIIRELISLFFSRERQSELSLDFFVLPKAEKVNEYRTVFKKIKTFYGW